MQWINKANAVTDKYNILFKFVLFNCIIYLIIFFSYVLYFSQWICYATLVYYLLNVIFLKSYLHSCVSDV